MVYFSLECKGYAEGEETEVGEVSGGQITVALLSRSGLDFTGRWKRGERVRLP